MGARQLNQADLLVGPQEFFREKITVAAANQKLSIPNDVEFYVVNLLCGFIAPGRLETIEGELNALETPLAIMLKQALEAPPAHKLKIYKYLGDTSLYFAGFFQDYFNRKAFDIDYYITLGSTAYQNVAGIMREQHSDDQFGGTFRNLSNKFHNLVELIAEVSELPGNTGKPIDILAIYDRWTRNNSDRLRRMLHDAGITPIPNLPRDKQ
jgi:hypothetical protein